VKKFIEKKIRLLKIEKKKNFDVWTIFFLEFHEMKGYNFLILVLKKVAWRCQEDCFFNLIFLREKLNQ
jgi:hypothetical protein